MGGAAHAVGDGWDLPTLLSWLGLGLIVAVVLGVKAARHPMRERADAMHLWRARFPLPPEAEIQRFLRVVGQSYGFRAEHGSKLRPDDTLAAIPHRWSGGDGLELVELVMAVEDEYSRELPEEFLTTDKTLAELFDCVTRPPARLGSSPPSEGLP